MVKLLLSRARRQVKISRLIYTNSGDSILALASNTIHLPWIWPRNDHNSSSKNGDARNMVDVKSRISEGSNDKSKIWKLIEINEPSHCRSLKLPENVKVNKISRLIYTNSGNAILALASNAIHLLWKWPRNDRNSSSMANASVQPQLWQPSSGIMMTNDIAHSNPEDSVPCFALSKNDSYVMSASGGKISLFNMMTFKTMTTFMPPPPAATFLAFHPQDNNIIAIGMDDSSIQIYNVRVDEVKSKLKGHTKRITGLAFSHVLNVFVSSGADAQICVWNTDGWEKQKTRFLQLPPGRTPSAQSDTRVQFHQDQIQFLVVHETQLSIFEATKLECLKQISRLIYTNYGDSILALASNTIHLPWIWPRNDHNSSSKNGDARNTGDVKPRISEGSNDKSKIWKLTEINEPSHCRSLKLPENVKVNKISRLIYTNSGDSILALASNTIHLLWIWQRNDRNSSSKTKTTFMPPPPAATFLVFNASNLRLRCRINPSAYSVRQFSTRRRGQGNHRHKQQKSSCFEDYYPVAWLFFLCFVSITYIVIREKDMISDEEEEKNLPDAVDWREKGVITPVLDQKDSSICWAMAAVAAVECLICQTTGALVRLSVQELVDCVAGDCICVEGGCNIYGGYKECAFYYIQKRGIGLADDYPLVYQTQPCAAKPGGGRVRYHIDGFVRMPITVFDESNLKRAVARQPVVVTISVGHKFLGYREGIYKGEDFGDPRRETHSVLVVGYGTLDGEDFWLIKNSHGPDWGMSGYGRILRNSGLRYGICGILKKPAYPVIKSII